MHGPVELSSCKIKWTFFVPNEPIGVSAPITLFGKKDWTCWNEWIATEHSLRKPSACSSYTWTLSPAPVLGGRLHHIRVSESCETCPGWVDPYNVYMFGLRCLFLSTLFKEVLQHFMEVYGAAAGMPCGSKKKGVCWIKDILRLWVQTSEPEPSWGWFFKNSCDKILHRYKDNVWKPAFILHAGWLLQTADTCGKVQAADPTVQPWFQRRQGWQNRSPWLN